MLMVVVLAGFVLFSEKITFKIILGLVFSFIGVYFLLAK
jgi:drug/metabolite transporter (DMT)-like permease